MGGGERTQKGHRNGGEEEPKRDIGMGGGVRTQKEHRNEREEEPKSDIGMGRKNPKGT